MKQFIFCAHSLELKTIVMTDATVRHFDCVSPQKTTLEIPLHYEIENNDIVVIRDQASLETEYIGIIDTVAHDKTTTILTYPFENVFDNDCLLTELDGSVYDWIVDNISRNFINTGDALNDYPITFESRMLNDISYMRIIESENLLDNLTDIFLNTGVYLRFGMVYNLQGVPVSIKVSVCNANEEDTIFMRFDNPIIVNNDVLIESSHTGNPNKAIIRIMNDNDQVLDTVKLYLKENNTLTTNPEDAERIKQVKPKIIDYTPSEDEITAKEQGEAIILLAEKALCGNAFDHSIEFTVVTNESYDWRPNKRCDFVAEDRIYYTYVTSVEYLSDRHAKIQLGAYRYTLTDRFKSFRKKEVDATSIKGLPVTDLLGKSLFWFGQDDRGHLILHYPSTISQPSFSIDGSGHLIFSYEGAEGKYDGKYMIDSQGKLVYNL